MFKFLAPLFIIFVALSCKKDSATSNVFSFDARNDFKLNIKLDLLSSLENPAEKLNMANGGLFLVVSYYDETSGSFKAAEISRKGEALSSYMPMTSSDIGNSVPVIVNSQLSISTSLSLLGSSQPIYKFTVVTQDDTELLKTLTTPQSNSLESTDLSLASTVATEMLLETDASLTNTAALSSFKDIVKTIEIIQTDAESKLAKTATFTPDTLIKSLKTFIASTVLMDSTNRDKITEQLSQAGASNTNKGWGAIEKIITAAADKVDSYAEIFQDKSDLKTVVTIAQEQVKNNPVSGSTENTSNPPSPSPRNDDGPDTTPPSSGMLTVSPSTMSSFAATWSLMLGYSTDNVTPQANILYRAVRVPHPNYLMAAGAAVNCVSPCKVLRDWASYTPVIDVDLPHNTSTYVNIVVKDAAGNATLYPGQNINTSYLSAATDISGTFTYAYVNENNEAHVYRSNLSGSSYISSPLSNPAATNLASKQIAVAIQSSYPYLLYAQPAGEFQEAVLKKHTGSSWETLDSAYSTGQTPGSNFYPHLTPYSSSYMYLSFLTYVSGSRIQHRKWNGSAFADGGYLAFNLYSAISGFYSASYIYWFGATSDDANNRFYKNYPDSNSLSSVVASFPSNTAVGEPVGDAGNTIAVDGSTIYVAYYEQSQNNKIRVARYNGSMIENVSVPEVEGMYDSPYASNASLLFQNGYLYLLYKDNALGGKIYLKKFDPPSSTWSCVACPIWNEEYSVPVMSYLDSNSKVNVAALPIDSNIPVNYQFNP